MSSDPSAMQRMIGFRMAMLKDTPMERKLLMAEEGSREFQGRDWYLVRNVGRSPCFDASGCTE